MACNFGKQNGLPPSGSASVPPGDLDTSGSSTSALPQTTSRVPHEPSSMSTLSADAMPFVPAPRYHEAPATNVWPYNDFSWSEQSVDYDHWQRGHLFCAQEHFGGSATTAIRQRPAIGQVWQDSSWQATSWDASTPPGRGGAEYYDMSSHREPATHMRYNWQEPPRESGAWTPVVRPPRPGTESRCQKPCGRCGKQCSFADGHMARFCLCSMCGDRPTLDRYSQPCENAPPGPHAGDVTERNTAQLFSRVKAMETRDLPRFNGDPEEVVDYLRKVELFEMVDGGDPDLKAVWLLSALSGLAWTQALEAFSPAELQGPHGMDMFKSHIRLHYQKFEVQQEAEIMNEYLERSRRRHNEEHRAYGTRYKTLLMKMHRIGVSMPDAMAAFVYWKKNARFTETQKAAILTSCGNKFRLDKMIEAACIQTPSVGAQSSTHGAHKASRFEGDSDSSSASSGDNDEDGGGEVPMAERAEKRGHGTHALSAVSETATANQLWPASSGEESRSDVSSFLDRCAALRRDSNVGAYMESVFTTTTASPTTMNSDVFEILVSQSWHNEQDASLYDLNVKHSVKTQAVLDTGCARMVCGMKWYLRFS